MINLELVEKLAEKIPSAQMLLNSAGYHERLIISNRNDVYTITVRFHPMVFFDFCAKNQISVSDSLKSILKNYQTILVDIDSLTTDSYRFYIEGTNFKNYDFWKKLEKFPLVELDMDLAYSQSQWYIDYYLTKNELEFFARVNAADTSFPVIFSVDDLNLYSLRDGAHRIYKLKQQGEKTVSARIISLSELEKILNLSLYESPILEDNMLAAPLEKIKSSVESEETTFFNLKKFIGTGIYYDVSEDNISLYKFYFMTENQTITQYKIDNNNQYLGKYQEIIASDDSYFTDSIGIKKLFEEHKRTSNKRVDVNQSYLITSIGK